MVQEHTTVGIGLGPVQYWYVLPVLLDYCTGSITVLVEGATRVATVLTIYVTPRHMVETLFNARARVRDRARATEEGRSTISFLYHIDVRRLLIIHDITDISTWYILKYIPVRSYVPGMIHTGGQHESLSFS